MAISVGKMMINHGIWGSLYSDKPIRISILIQVGNRMIYNFCGHHCYHSKWAIHIVCHELL